MFLKSMCQNNEATIIQSSFDSIMSSGNVFQEYVGLIADFGDIPMKKRKQKAKEEKIARKTSQQISKEKVLLKVL